jgi:hypothetical protein
MLIWWAPVAAAALAVHGEEAWRRFSPARACAPHSPRAPVWTVVAAAIAVLFFVATPLGMQLLSGRKPDLEQSVSGQTPVAATAWLREQPPAGQLFNIYEWGDYLVWAGPPKVPVFVTSHAHLVTPDVWRDYLTVVNLRSGWADVLDRYRVTTVVVDKFRSGALIARLRKNNAWRAVYEDEIAVIFARQESSPGGRQH